MYLCSKHQRHDIPKIKSGNFSSSCNWYFWTKTLSVLSRLTCQTDLSRPMSRLSCPVCPSTIVLPRMSCVGCMVSVATALLPWLCCLGHHVSHACAQLSCPYCHVLTILSCPGCPVLTVLFSTLRHKQAVLLVLSCSGYPGLSLQICPDLG
jgi:hypothetical protein